MDDTQNAAEQSMNYRRATVHPDFYRPDNQRANRRSTHVSQRLYNILHIICIIIVFAPSIIVIVWAIITAIWALF